MGKRENRALLLMGIKKRSQVSLFFTVSSKGTQSLKASAAVETATCYYIVSTLMTIYSNFYHSVLPHHKHVTSYIIQIAAFPAKYKIKLQES